MKPRPKLLIIDDNVDEMRFLSDFGYELKLLNTGKDALEYLKSTKVKYNLVILDVMVSFVSGWEILKYLRNNDPFEFVPVIVLTELKDKTDQLLALRSGADDFIRKPFDVDLLLARIDVALRRSMWNKLAFINLKELPFIDLTKEFVSLTTREQTILQALSKGYSNEQIAKNLVLSTLTVKTHVKNIFKKLNVSNRTEAILIGLNLGLIKVD